MNIAKKFDVDVLVCGGGVAGAAAGVAAARLGARTLLVEGRESLGGLCTNGYISGIAGVVEGLCEEWVDRLAAKGAALKRPHLPVIEPEMGKMELEQMLLQAGCRILYGVHVVDCVVEDGDGSTLGRSPPPRAASWRSEPRCSSTAPATPTWPSRRACPARWATPSTAASTSRSPWACGSRT